MIKLVVDDIKNTGRVMDAAVSAGANRIDSIRFTVRDADKYKDEALKRATKDAERKAKMIAASLGKNVTNVIAVNENHVNVSPRYMMNVKMAADSGMGNATTPMEGGDASVESSVTIVFEIG